MAEQLPGRVCLCDGDGETWASCAACPTHTTETSPKFQELERVWRNGLAYGRGWADGRAHALEEITSEATIKAAVDHVPAHPIDPPYTVRLIAEALMAAAAQGADHG